MPNKKIKNEVETRFTANDRMTRQLSIMSRAMTRLNRIAARAKRALNAAGRAAVYLGRMAGRFAKVGLIAAAGAATTLFYSVTKLAGGMDELAKSTRALDFPIEDFQEYRFAAEQAGISGDKFGASVKKFAKTVGELKGGYGAMYTALKNTNPQLLKQLKATNNTEEAFSLYLKAIRETPGAMNKAALATAGFGRSGMDMINMANLSAKQLEELRAQMRENGVVTADQAAKAEEFNDMMNRVKLTLKGVAVDGLTPLMPLLTRGMDELRKWVVSNREIIKQKIETVFKNMLKFGRMAFDFLKQNVPQLLKRLKQIGTDGFRWINENKAELTSFGNMILSIGRTLLKIAEFAIKNKEAVIALVISYKALGVAMSLINWSGFMNGAANAGAAVGGLQGKVKGLSAMLGKGGLLVASFAAGWAAGSILFDKWNTSAANLALNAENMAARVSMAFRKMNDEQLKSTDKTLAAREKKLTSFWERSKAFITGNFHEHQSAIKAVKDARIKGLEEQKRRITENNRLVEEYNRQGFMAGRQSGGIGDRPALNPIDRAAQSAHVESSPQIIPEVQMSRSESTKIERTEIVIRDETGRAEITRGSTARGLTLVENGAM